MRIIHNCPHFYHMSTIYLLWVISLIKLIFYYMDKISIRENGGLFWLSQNFFVFFKLKTILRKFERYGIINLQSLAKNILKWLFILVLFFYELETINKKKESI